MNSTSASLNGSRPRPAGVACRPADERLAQALLLAAASSITAAANRNGVRIRPPGRRIVFHSTVVMVTLVTLGPRQTGSRPDLTGDPQNVVRTPSCATRACT